MYEILKLKKSKIHKIPFWGPNMFIVSIIVWAMWVSMCQKKYYSFYMQICLAKVRFNKQYSEEKKEGIFRRNLGRLWSLFHSFDRLPLQDNEGKGLKEKRETLQGENDSNMIHSIWQVCMFRISHIPSRLYSPWRYITYLLYSCCT